MSLDTASIEALARIAYELGPFFFSLVFLLFVVGMSNRCYKEVNLRTEPEASDVEKKCYRIFFISSFIASILLVFISVGWWMYSRIEKHTLQGIIIGLQPSQTLVPYTDDIYFRTIERPVADELRIKDIHFAIVRDSPFYQGQGFSFYFYPMSGYIGEKKPEPITLNIDYTGKAYEKYKLTRSGESFILEKAQ